MKRSVLNLIITDRMRWRLTLLIVALLAAFFGLLAPFFQKSFVDQLTGSKTLLEIDGLTNQGPVFYIIFSFICLLASQALNQLTNYIGAREALVSQRKLAESVYQKTLSLKVDTMSQRPIGEIVSLYATDVPGSTILLEQILPQGTSTFFPLIMAPVALSFLLHTSLFWTIVVMSIVSVLNTALAFKQSKYFFLFKQLAAERIALVNEWITLMRGLRILGWMDAFEKKIYQKRVVETRNRISMVTNGQVMNSISSSMTFALNTIALASLTIGTDRPPTSGEILASLWILGIFLTKPFRQMPWFFTFAFDGWTSVKRLQTFLDLNNADSPGILGSSNPAGAHDKETWELQIQGLHLQLGATKPLLDNVDFSIRQGEFVAIVGEVGSGKSLFLLSLLRETGAFFRKYEINGKSVLNAPGEEVKASFGYVPQESFIMSATLEQNVVFDYSHSLADSTAVKKALTDSQLRTDTDRLPEGLQSELGERGVNLSGGQRQRISLARVAYHDRQIILVDDGFSNLDVTTEQALLKSLFFGRWKDKSRILVTHRLSVLPYTDRVIFMKDGRFASQGSFEDLLAIDPDFREFTTSLAQKEIAAHAP